MQTICSKSTEDFAFLCKFETRICIVSISQLTFYYYHYINNRLISLFFAYCVSNIGY